jgi:hypothetical protein
MKNFKQYYEAYELVNEGANTHLTHLEELILKKGQVGYEQARTFLTNLLSHLQGKSKRKIGTTVKWDGAPAIFCGRHPDNGKFFLGTKSIYNKNPKINYSINDIEVNHGDNAGLAVKLKRAFPLLQQLGIKNIMQGDLMFDSASINKEDIDDVPHYTFKPNTIKYAVEANSALGKKLSNSVLGVIFHTEYDSIDGNASYGAKVNKLKNVPGVWVDDAFFKDDTGVVTLTTDETKQVRDYIKTADSIKVNYKNLPLDDINIYINSEIRQGKFLDNPEQSYNMFINWLEDKKVKAVEKLKSVRGKRDREESWKKKIAEVTQEKNNIVNLFKVTKLLSQAKHMFINKYNTATYTTKHFVDDGTGVLKTTAPEGFVAVSNDGSAVKLVDRLEFSKANFNPNKQFG